MQGNVGIAHTRWATHGPPNECNAHPHHDCKGKISVVHNGIIENYGPLRAMLKKTGHTFVSDTDTEVLAHLIEAAFDGNLEEAVVDALALVEGTYGIAVISGERPGQDRRGAQGQPAADRPRRGRELRRQRRGGDPRAHARRSSTSTTARWRCSRATAIA